MVFNLPDYPCLIGSSRPSILGGRLFVSGIPEWGPWEASRLEHHSEAYVDAGVVPATGARKVRT
jgi:hypothetical protein